MILKIPQLAFFMLALQLNAQNKVTTLKADGPGGTYELIDSVLAPIKGSALEAPGVQYGECNNHSDFKNINGNAEHISEIIDSEMGPVFQFTLHVNEDKDRHKCNTKDRQRNEIKTYRSSPDYLKATVGEKIEYKWTMKLPTDFKASNNFTHLHQIKSIGASDNGDKIPLITLTAFQKSSGAYLNLRYAAETTQETLTKVSLDEFKGHWVEFTETIEFKKGKKGTYHILMKNIKNGKTILDFKHKGIMYKKDSDLMRPKWGIYRSLKSSKDIKDENVLFGYFQITEFK